MLIVLLVSVVVTVIGALGMKCLKINEHTNAWWISNLLMQCGLVTFLLTIFLGIYYK